MDPHEQLTTRFIHEKEYHIPGNGSLSKMFFWVEEAGLKASENDPPILDEFSYDMDFAYFIKFPLSQDEQVSEENVSELIADGVVKSNYLKTLLKMMNS
jgi:hypothetical protein